MVDREPGSRPEGLRIRDRSPTYRGKPLEEVMAMPRRQALLEAVAADPGISLNELARVLGVSTSSVIWHYEVLHALSLIMTERQGIHRRYFLGPRAGPWLRRRKARPRG